MKAITNTHGPHIIASDGDGNRLITPVNAARPIAQSHAEAAKALCAKMKWHGTLIGNALLEAGRMRKRVWVWRSGTTITIPKE